MQHLDPTINGFLHYWEKQQWPSHSDLRSESKATVTLLRQWDRIYHEDGLLYKMVHDQLDGEVELMIISECLKEQIL